MTAQIIDFQQRLEAQEQARIREMMYLIARTIMDVTDEERAKFIAELELPQ